MKITFLCLLGWIITIPSFAQAKEERPPAYIKTITFSGNEEYGGIPIIKLGQSLTLEFDDLVGDEADYYYKISHYTYDWMPSDLVKTEYIKGFDDMRIKSYKNSRNTLQIYTHYSLSIPNEELKALKVSGNYILEIYNRNNELIFSKRFIVYENLTSIQTAVKRARDLDYIDTYQVINFSIIPEDRLSLKNPDKNLNTLILKNRDLQTSISNLKPQYHEGNKLIYRYDKEAAFLAGNEFLYFDSKDVRTSTVNIAHVELGDIYNIHLYPDEIRANKVYTYNPDVNGGYRVNIIQGNHNATESEYTWVHFSLDYDKPSKNEEIHVFGGFNNFNINESTRMSFNSESQHYEARLLLKQGFYNYKYILKENDGFIDYSFSSGDFDKTENQYIVLAYYHEPGSRYDRIIGIGKANSQNITD